MKIEKRSYDIAAQPSVLNRLEKFFLFLQENRGSSRIYGLWFDGDGDDRPFQVDHVYAVPGGTHNSSLRDFEGGECARNDSEGSNQPYVNGSGEYDRIRLIDNLPSILRMIEVRGDNLGVRTEALRNQIKCLFSEWEVVQPVEESVADRELTEEDRKMHKNHDLFVGEYEHYVGKPFTPDSIEDRINQQPLSNLPANQPPREPVLEGKIIPYRPFGQFLVDAGAITEKQLQNALDKQNTTMRVCRIGEILIRFGYMTREEMLRHLSRHLGIPVIELSKIKIFPEVLSQFPTQWVLSYSMVPIREEEGSLVVAAQDPTSPNIDLVAKLLGKPIRVVIALPQDINQAFHKYYDRPGTVWDGFPSTSRR